MNTPDDEQVESGRSRKVAEEKGRDRLALAAMPPEEAQTLVTSLPPDGGSWVDVTPEGSPMPSGDSEWVHPSLYDRVAEEKSRGRMSLAKLPPEQAQALVSSGIPASLTTIPVREEPERPSLGLAANDHGLHASFV